MSRSGKWSRVGYGHGSLERRAPPVRRDGQVSAPRAHAGPGDRRPEQCRAGLRLGRDAGRPLCQRRRLWLRWRVGAMSRLRHTESARIGGEGRRFAVTSEPTDSHDRLTLRALHLIRGADQHAAYVGRAAMALACSTCGVDDRHIVRGQRTAVSVVVDHDAPIEQLPDVAAAAAKTGSPGPAKRLRFPDAGSNARSA